jgi:hyperosmotically inducible protein
MKSKYIRHATLTAFLATALLGVGCASTQSASTQLGDSAITTKIAAKLASDPEINPFNVDVDTNEGVVTLSGAVEKVEAREEAEKLARNTEGVRKVINDITYGSRGIGERIDDGWITTKVKTKLTADPELNPFNINVDTKEGVVTLSGRVKTKAASKEAAELAAGTEGVKTVKNRLEVG